MRRRTFFIAGGVIALPLAVLSCLEAFEQKEGGGKTDAGVDARHDGGEGSNCASDSDCMAHARCLDHGSRHACVCLDQYRGCGRACANLATDPQHCGGCGNSCQPSQVCWSGLCLDPAAVPPAREPPKVFTVDAGPAVAGVSVYDAGLGSRADESVPTKSLNPPYAIIEGNNYAQHVGSQGNQWNWSDGGIVGDAGEWDNSFKTLPRDGGNGHTWNNNGDPGSTTSAYANRDYLSYVLKDQGPITSGNCIGVSSIDMTADAGWPNWTEPLTCITGFNNSAWDGPKIIYYGVTLYAVAGEPPALFSRSFCTGPIGSSTCAAGSTGFPRVPSDGGALMTGKNAGFEYNICTGSIVAANWNPNDLTVNLAFVTGSGTVSRCTIATDVHKDPNDKCSPPGGGGIGYTCGVDNGANRICRCDAGPASPPGSCSYGSNGDCLRLSHGTRISILEDDDLDCWAYVAWDESGANNNDGATRWRARMKRVRISHNGNDVCDELDGGLAVDLKAEYQSYMSQVVVNSYTGNAAWLYYKDQDIDGNGVDHHCATVYHGRFDVKAGGQVPDFSGATQINLSTASFPNIYYGGTDFVASVRNGLPGGSIYAAWTQPIVTSSSNGVLCGSTRYDERVLGRRIDVY